MYNICNTYNVLKLKDEKVVISDSFFFPFFLLFIKIKKKALIA